MEPEKIGFLQNSLGERSHTKFVNLFVPCVIVLAWAVISCLKKEFIPFPPILLGVIGVPGLQNSINKWIELSNGKNAKVMAELLDKVRK